MDISETLNTGANAERIKMMQQEQEAQQEQQAPEVADDSKPDYMAALEKINNPGQA
jgi:hypothetical protein